VDITPGGQQYTFSVVCGGEKPLSSGSLPFQVSFSAGSTPSVIFNIASGTVVSPGTFTINGFGKTKTITVSQIGNIMMQ
jgi:hypothetical protein